MLFRSARSDVSVRFLLVRLHLIRCAGGSRHLSFPLQSASHLWVLLPDTGTTAFPKLRSNVLTPMRMLTWAPCHRLAAEWPSVCIGLAHTVSSRLLPRQHRHPPKTQASVSFPGGPSIPPGSCLLTPLREIGRASCRERVSSPV